MKLKTFILLLCVFAFKKCDAQERSYYDSLAVMPPFTFYTLPGDVYTPDSLDLNKKTVLIYFKTTCESCREEITAIKENMDCFKNVQFIFVSKENIPVINSFIELFHLNDYPQFVILQDKDKRYYHYYTAHLTPSIHIYSNKKLLLFNDGGLYFDELYKYTEE